MKIKVNDNVLILTGKDKGKTGKVIKTIAKKDRVVVENINVVKKHMKASKKIESTTKKEKKEKKD